MNVCRKAWKSARPPRVRGSSRSDCFRSFRSVARELAEQLRLNVDLGKFPYQLSGGQQQLVALARALSSSPTALVMDEPFSSLGATMREDVRSKALRMIDNLGVTAVLVSHNLEDCIVCSDRVAFLTSLPARIHRVETVPLDEPKAGQRSDILHTS